METSSRLKEVSLQMLRNTLTSLWRRTLTRPQEWRDKMYLTQNRLTTRLLTLGILSRLELTAWTWELRTSTRCLLKDPTNRREERIRKLNWSLSKTMLLLLLRANSEEFLQVNNRLVEDQVWGSWRCPSRRSTRTVQPCSIHLSLTWKDMRQWINTWCICPQVLTVVMTTNLDRRLLPRMMSKRQDPWERRSPQLSNLKQVLTLLQVLLNCLNSQFLVKSLRPLPTRAKLSRFPMLRLSNLTVARQEM